MAQEPTSRRADAGGDSTAAPRRPRRTATVLVVLALLTGIGLRLGLLWLAPRYGYYPDHDDYVRWGIQANDKSITTLYTELPPRWDRVAYRSDGQSYLTQRTFDRVLNYPPAAAYLLWLEGRLHKACDAARVVNTATARLVFALLPALGDLLCAMASFSLVRWFGRQTAAAVAFAVVFLAPPLMIDSALWTQTDSWVLAPVLWMVRAMVDRRWLLAGAWWGLALAIKPQAMCLAAVWLYLFIAHPPRRTIVLATLLSVALLNIIALPFWLTSGATWVDESYIKNITTHFPRTTLSAFNVWYIDLMLSEQISSTQTVHGLTKDQWGKIFLALGVAVSYGLTGWRWGRRREAPLVLSALILLAVVMLPTRIHERYIVMTLPLVIALAFRITRLWPGAILLLAVATAQLMTPNWARHPAGRGARARAFHRFQKSTEDEPVQDLPQLQARSADYSRYRDLRARDWWIEWTLIVAALASYLYILAAIGSFRPQAAGVHRSSKPYQLFGKRR